MSLLLHHPPAYQHLQFGGAVAAHRKTQKVAGVTMLFRHPSWRRAASLEEAEKILQESGVPLPDYSSASFEELPFLRGLANLTVFTWRADAGLTISVLRKPGGRSRYMEEQVKPLLVNAPIDLQRAVQCVPRMKTSQPSLWRRDIIRLIVDRGFPQNFINAVDHRLIPRDFSYDWPPCSPGEAEQGNTRDEGGAGDGPSSSSNVVAKKRSASSVRIPRRKAKAARMSSCIEDGKADATELEGEASQGPVDVLQRALRNSFSVQHVSPETLRVLVGALSSKDLADVMEECLLLQSRVGALLCLCLERQAELLAAGQSVGPAVAPGGCKLREPPASDTQATLPSAAGHFGDV